MTESIKENRVMISAVSSGSGKTLVTLALLSAFQDMGLRVRAGKCGPDYIDPMFFKDALNIPSKNFDPFFEEPELMRALFYEHVKDSDIAILEGVMGYYDGVSFDNAEMSTYECAKALSCPVILVLNGRGMAYSMTGVIKGMLELKKDNGIKGVIINNVSRSVYERVAPVIERECGILPLGFIPRINDLLIESRHLGLMTPDVVADLGYKLEILRSTASECLDLKKIREIAEGAGDIGYDPDIVNFHGSGEKEKIRIALAKDRAFSFIYDDNLELLRKLGCEIKEFSPLEDKELPEGIQGLILPGGYPEVYASELSKNTEMRDSIKAALDKGLPCLAECGGFMYLHEEIEGEDGMFYKMAGFLPGEKCVKTEKLQSFGYVSLSCGEENPYLLPGEEIKAHEFHYCSSTDNGDLMTETKPSGRSFNGMHLKNNTLCGFPHLFYYSCPGFIRRFIDKCQSYAL